MKAKQLIEWGRSIPGAGHAWNSNAGEEAREVQIGREIKHLVNSVGHSDPLLSVDQNTAFGRIEKLADELIQMHEAGAGE